MRDESYIGRLKRKLSPAVFTAGTLEQHQTVEYTDRLLVQCCWCSAAIQPKGVKSAGDKPFPENRIKVYTGGGKKQRHAVVMAKGTVHRNMVRW